MTPGPHPDPPYPDRWRNVANFTYLTPLLLCREPSVLTESRGEDPFYTVACDFVACVEVDGEPWRVTTPAGMRTDLASSPWALRFLVERVGRHLEAAVAHDYLYSAWRRVPGRGANGRDRLFADLVMLRAMEAANVPRWRRHAIYRTLRLFGWRAFRHGDGDGRLGAPPDLPSIAARAAAAPQPSTNAANRANPFS